MGTPHGGTDVVEGTVDEADGSLFLVHPGRGFVELAGLSGEAAPTRYGDPVLAEGKTGSSVGMH